MNVSMRVNGEVREHDVEPRTLLVYYIRDAVGLTGTNIGCDTSSCGACTVLIDGESVKSCTVLAVQADGADITTIEGLADGDRLHPMQEAFRRAPRPAVRLLHPGHGDGRRLAAGRAPRPDRSRGPRGPRGQPLPLHRLPQHRPGRPGGRQGAGVAAASPAGSRMIPAAFDYRRATTRRRGRRASWPSTATTPSCWPAATRCCR